MKLSALDLVYPRSCFGCGLTCNQDEGFLCWECLAEVIFVKPPFCSLCGDPISGKIDHAYVCYFCTSLPRFFDKARSSILYDGILRKALQAFKYQAGLWLYHDLVSLIYACTTAQLNVDRIDMVTCVPLHARRRRKRGYNQSYLLAKGLSSKIDKPLKKNLLKRIRSTKSQTDLTARERITNLEAAFKAKKGACVKDQHILLVDDIMTTGVTVNECARTLKEAGASEVSVVTVARGSQRF